MRALKFPSFFLLLSLTIILSTPELHAEMPWKCVANCGSGGSGGGGSAPRQTYTPQDNSWQQQQQREEEERKRIEAEQKKLKEELAEQEKKRREEFEKGKQDALKLLKGAGTGELGLKGFDTGNDIGFKETGDSSSQDSSVVDLRHLDPNKPITVDPNVVKGKERKMPVQVSDKALSNENYNKGFAAILANDHSAAVQYFKKAEAELPTDDILVKNALGLAEALAKEQNLAYKEAAKGVLTALDGDYDTAIKHLESALKIDPDNQSFRENLKYIEGLKKGIAIGSRIANASSEKALKEKAWKIADQSLAALFRKDYNSAILILEAAHTVDPANQTFSDALEMVKDFRNKAMR